MTWNDGEIEGVLIESMSLHQDARGWLGDGANADPNNKYIVSVTVNDTPWFCKCELFKMRKGIQDPKRSQSKSCRSGKRAN